jgi:hypothetical protein
MRTVENRASLAAVYAAGTDTFQIQSALNLAYLMILKNSGTTPTFPELMLAGA